MSTKKSGIDIPKILSLVVNGLFAAVGVLFIGAGSYLISKTDDIVQSIGLPVDNLPIVPLGIVAIIIGILLIILSVVAIVGVVSEKKALLAFYLPVVFFIVAAQLSVVIVAAIFRQNIINEIDQRLGEEWRTESNAETVAQLEQNFQCCGYEDPQDAATDGCTFTTGCRTALVNQFEDILTPILIGAVVTVVLEVVALITTCAVRNRVEKNEFVDKFNH